MKILAIRGCNIASLEGNFEIDFTREPLASNGIYTITGPTGSGKSTILDVICIALYNKTPRLQKASGKSIMDIGNEMVNDDMTKNLLRRGAVEGFAEVDFVAVSGEVYRVRWFVYRARHRMTGRIQDPVYTLLNLTTGVDYSEKTKSTLARLESLVGLSYAQFSRAVLLAQGEFSAFLKAADNERAELLEKLTGTDVYSRISTQVYLHCDAAKRELDSLNTRLDEYRLLPDDALLLLQQQHAEKTALIKDLRDVQKGLEKVLLWFTQDKQFQDQIQKADEDLALVEKRSNEFSPIDLRLQLLDRLKPIEKEFEHYRSVKTDLNSQKTLAIQTETNLKEHEQKVNLAQTMLDQALDHFRRWNDREPALRADLKVARELDIQLKGVDSELKNLQQTSDTVQAQLDAAVSKEKESQRELNQTQKTIENTEKWLKEHLATEALVENKQLIFNRLSLLVDYRKRYADLVQQEQVLALQCQVELAEIASLTKALKDQEMEYETFQRALSSKQSQFDAIQIEELNRCKTDLDSEVNMHNALAFIWNALEPILADQSKTSARIEGNRQSIDVWSNRQVELAQHLTAVKVRLDQTNLIEQEYQLKVSNSVIEMRATLKKGEACPVCGSKEHYYTIEQVPEFRLALETVQEQKNGLTEQKSDLERQLVKTEADISSAVGENERLTNQLSQQQVRINELRQEWQGNRMAVRFEAIAEEQKGKAIQEARKEVSVHLEKCNQQIAEYNALLIWLNRARQENQQRELTLANQRNNLIRLETQAHNNKANLESLGIRKAECLSLLEQEKQQLDQYWEDDAWWIAWKANASLFAENLNRQVAEWIACEETLEKSRTDLLILNNRLITEREQKAVLITQRTEVSEKIAERTKLRALLSDQRIQYFEGCPADDAETSFEKQKQLLYADSERCKKDFDGVNSKWNLLKGEFVQISEHTAKLARDLDETKSKITGWLGNYNTETDSPLTFDIVQELLDIPHPQIVIWRNRQKELADTILSAQTARVTHLENRRRHLSARPDNELSEQSALELIREKGDLLLAEESLCNNLGYQLQEQRQNAQKRSALLEEQQCKRTIYENWAKLNDAIGQKDGAKFRTFAQGYTLDVLLQSANVHIRQIAPRYKLQRIPDTLSLQVIDRDMCDNVRSVHSLSGGETFLVSLALALGLSSLSSHQMNIESLFIDEGFGSLDQETLSAAMDALESLRLQGRKVGVITHVREMTERITAKVVLRKRNNGASSIEVLG